MHSLVNELAKKLDLTPKEAEAAISAFLIRIRAALETVGEARVEGLGTFRSNDGAISFEPAPSFNDAINKEFAGLRPVALTATGESVDVDDVRAIPGVDPTLPVESEVQEDPLDSADPASEDASVRESDDAVKEEEPEEDSSSRFKSPPPPTPSKVRVPPSERRARRRRKPEAARTGDDFPDMKSVVTTRPVEPIHSGKPPKRRSKAPAVVAVVIIVGGLLSWLVLGGGEDDEATAGESTAASQQIASQQATPREVDVSVEAAAKPVAKSVSQNAGEPDVQPAQSEEEIDVNEPEAAAVQVETAPEVAAPDPEPEQASPVEESAVPEAPAAADAPAYAWIVASYPSRNEAEARVTALKGAGFDARVHEAVVRGEPAFRVGVGRFTSEAEALRNQEGVPPESPDAWITRVN